MKVFIIGASGLVGGNCMQCMHEDPEMDVIGSHFSFATIDTEYFNVFNPAGSTFDLSDFDPDVIVHTGALTHVDHCETHPEESFHHTVESTKAALDLANKYQAKFVYISSDYIFDGREGPYDEEAKANPLSVYGKHKWQAEEIIRNKTEDHLILRITNVYGDEAREKNFIAFLAKIAQSGEDRTLSLPVDQFATPVNAADVGKMICCLIKDNKKGIYNIASNEYLNRVELAEKVLKYFPGSNVKIEGVPTWKLGQAAPRPLKGGLINKKIRNEYKDQEFSTVDDYMKEHYGI
ncbi:MAG: SDR family oxidoreductase [Candidatus Marinimicrobia bacterium]|nr:SDR family oxidoreductase [Candidatus Neomarinimicrobiota bacterium]